MQRIKNRYVCEYCGSWIEARRNELPRAVLVGASGRKTVRVLTVDGIEVHRCEVCEPRFNRRVR